MIFEYFLVFQLMSTPSGDELANSGYFVLDRCPTKAHCSELAKEYREVWPIISQFGQYLIMAQEQAI